MHLCGFRGSTTLGASFEPEKVQYCTLYCNFLCMNFVEFIHRDVTSIETHLSLCACTYVTFKFPANLQNRAEITFILGIGPLVSKLL